MSRKKRNEEPNIGIPEFLQEAKFARLNDELTREKFPLLFDLLVPRYDEEGKLVYGGGRLSIAPEGPNWRVSMDVDAHEVSAQVRVESISEILSKIEDLLRGHQLFWGPSFKKKKRDLQRLARPIQ